MDTNLTVIKEIVAHFQDDESRLTANNSGYTETEVRIEYIDRLFSCLGWDMSNFGGLPNSIKDVLREESQATEASSKRPDYTFRIAGIRKFFVEAKKPSIDIKLNKSSAFQVRSYGWTANLPISILTNFRTLRVYDTKFAPKNTDDVDVGLLLDIDYRDLPDRFKELKGLIGHESVANGSIEREFGTITNPSITVNLNFLNKINNWRLLIANDLHSRFSSLNIEELNDLSQLIINRIIFIRMCEDRGIESQEKLRSAIHTRAFIDLQKLFQEMDNRYDTGLFDIKNDPFQTHYFIDSQILLDIVEDLYYPQSPYSFSVLDADFLGQVYEIFLIKRLALDDSENLCLQDKPIYEGREIITTPQPLVDEVTRRTISERLEALRNAGTFNYKSLLELHILDLAVGSGRFLLRCLDELFDAAIECYKFTADKKKIYKRSEGDYRLAFSVKRELLESCIHGIDIDYNAVEIARFSLLVKLLEDENQSTLPVNTKILPNLDDNIVWGNSVLDNYAVAEDEIALLHPLDWDALNFPEHFDIIVSNPPYIKTEEMKSKTPSEFRYFKENYDTPYKQFDKYFVFIERAISKLSNQGCAGFIVPNKWMNIEAARKLRYMISSQGLLAELINFGNEWVFEGKSNYVCMLILSKVNKGHFWYSYVDEYSTWLMSPTNKGVKLDHSRILAFSENPWILPSNENENKILSKLYSNSIPLGDVAKISNGIQTSQEEIFSVSDWSEQGQIIQFTKNGRVWAIEKGITKPYLSDSESRVWSFLQIQADRLLIFPYEYSGDNTAILIPPARMKAEYPLTWNYLYSFKRELSNRDVSPEPSPGEFYRYGRHQALFSAFSVPKIIYSVNQLGDKYGIDLTGIGFASGGTAGEVAISNPLLGYSLEFILGLLNQPIVEFFMHKRGSPFGGGYYSRGSAVVSDLPVPRLDFNNRLQNQRHDSIASAVKKLINIEAQYRSTTGRKKATLKQQRTTLQNLLRGKFAEIWELSQDEINFLGSSV